MREDADARGADHRSAQQLNTGVDAPGTTDAEVSHRTVEELADGRRITYYRSGFTLQPMPPAGRRRG